MADKPLKKCIRPTKYKGRCPEIERILKRSGLRSLTKSLIMNGNLCKTIMINKKKRIIYNTCPFDSLLASTVLGYIESTRYRDYISDNQSISGNSFLDICREVANHKINEIIYLKQGKFILDVFGKSGEV